MKKSVIGLLLSLFALSVLAIPFAEATSTPYLLGPLVIIKYRLACVDAAGIITRTKPTFDMPAMAQAMADMWAWFGKMCWVEAVDVTTGKMVPMPPAPVGPLPPVPPIPPPA